MASLVDVLPTLANHIRCLVEKRWKYAVYYDVYTGKLPEYELYDMQADPIERYNLAVPAVVEEQGLDPAAIDAVRQEMHRKLTERMRELGTTPWNVHWPEESGSTDFVRTDQAQRKVDPVKHAEG